jgi:hypothetical protein
MLAAVDANGTFMDVVNSGGDLLSIVQMVCDAENKFQADAAARKQSGNQEQQDPQNPVMEPIRVDAVDLEDRDMGYAVISGGGLAAPVKVPFSAHEVISEWWHSEVMVNIP